MRSVKLRDVMHSASINRTGSRVHSHGLGLLQYRSSRVSRVELQARSDGHVRHTRHAPPGNRVAGLLFPRRRHQVSESVEGTAGGIMWSHTQDEHIQVLGGRALACVQSSAVSISGLDAKSQGAVTPKVTFLTVNGRGFSSSPRPTWRASPGASPRAKVWLALRLIAGGHKQERPNR